MDIPQGPQRGQIITFPQAQQRSVAKAKPGSTDPISDDRIVQESPSQEPSSTTSTVSHLRALSLGVSSGAFFPTTPTEDVPRKAAELGIHTVELMLQSPGEYDPAFIEDLDARARDAGVTVRSVHTMLRLHPLFDPYARRVREGRELFDLGIQAAATLGADVLVWHGAKIDEVSEPEGWENFVRVSTELARACGSAGVTLGLENVSYCALAKVRDVVRMATRMDEIGPPEQIGFVFDPFQAMRADANPFMILAAMGNRLANVHISDYSTTDSSLHHLPPGDGNLPWSALLRAIAGSGYTGPLIIESPLGPSRESMDRVWEHIEPRIRSIFDFAPDAGGQPGSVMADPARIPDGVMEGIELFNQRRFFEAHEVIEHEWHAERSSVRRLYQGILQIGVGFYHALNGNHKGAVLLLTDGLEKTAAFTPEPLGIQTGKLVAESQSCLAAIEALGTDRLDEFDAATIPLIEFGQPDEPVGTS